jgi:hypothetical protein
VSSADGSGFQEAIAAFEGLFAHPNARPLDAPWIERYRQRRTIQRPIVEAADVEWEAPQAPVVPNEVQQAALRALEDTRAAGNHAGLVVLATGLGKTWLSAFDTSRPEFRRVLFVAHREEILNQALDTFRRIRPDARLGHYTGDIKDPDAEVVFAFRDREDRRPDFAGRTTINPRASVHGRPGSGHESNRASRRHRTRPSASNAARSRPARSRGSRTAQTRDRTDRGRPRRPKSPLSRHA